MTRLRTIALVAVMCSPLAVSAEAEEPRRVAVMDIKSSGAVSPKSVEGLSQLLAVEASRVPGVSVISSNEVEAMLGLEAQKQMLNCDDSVSCLTEIGGALGAAYLLSTEVTRVGKNLLLYVTLLDVESARAVKREARRPKSEDDLIDETIEAVRVVMSALTPEGAVLADPPKERKPVDARPWIRWGGTAVGVGVLAGGALGLYAPAAGARADHRDEIESGQPPSLTRQQALDYESQADLGLGLMAGGVAVAAAAWVIPMLMDGPAPDAVAAYAGPDGAYLLAGWRF